MNSPKITHQQINARSSTHHRHRPSRPASVRTVDRPYVKNSDPAQVSNDVNGFITNMSHPLGFFKDLPFHSNKMAKKTFGSNASPTTLKIYNPSSRTCTSSEISLLQKGPNFAPHPLLISLRISTRLWSNIKTTLKRITSPGLSFVYQRIILL